MCTITTASLRTFPSPRRRLWAAGLPPARAATSLRAVGADLCSARHVKGGRVCGLCKRCLSLSMTVQAVACTVLHLCPVSHGQAPRNPPQGVLSCFQWSRDQNGPQDNQGTGPRSHRARHTTHVTPRRSRDQNGPQDNPGAGPRSHRAGTGTSAGQPFFCCRAASPVLGSVGLCGPSRDLCRGRSQVPPAAIWGCLRRPRAVMPPGWALAQEVGGMFCLGRALQHRLL